MKTLKSVLVATIVAIALMSFVESPTHPPKENLIKITIEQAQTNSGLVIAMYQQLKPGMLKPDQNGLYVGVVKYHFKRIEISGTLEAWIVFFRNEPKWAHDE